MKSPKHGAVLQQNNIVYLKGGAVAKAARMELENSTGKKVVTKLNAKVLMRGKNKEIED